MITATGFAESDLADTNNLRLQVEGMNVANDYNFLASGVPKNVLEVNDGLSDGLFQGLKGHDSVSVPVQVTQTGGDRNFVASGPTETLISANIRFADKVNNHIYIDNPVTNGTALQNRLPPTPFYVEIFQQLDSRYFNERANFYVGGSEFTFTQENTVTGGATHVEPLLIKPRHANFVKVFLDNIEKSSFTLTTSTEPATVSIVTAADDSQIRVEIDQYTPPAIEVGDNVQFSSENVFVVAGTTYDTGSTNFDAEKTQNNIYQIELATTPVANLTGVTMVNLGTDVTGTLNNVGASAGENSATIDFNKATFPGNFRLANSRSL